MLTWPFSRSRRRQHQRFKRRELAETLIDTLIEDETEHLKERERELMKALSASKDQVWKLTQERDALQRLLSAPAADAGADRGE